jgi:hypothetical protein
MLTYEQKVYLQKAQEAICYVKSKIHYGSNTEKDSKCPSWEPYRIFDLRREVMQQAVAYASKNNGKADFSIISVITKRALKKFGFGNCGEQAQTAFVYLKKRGVFPLDFCITTLGGHNVVILGRSKASDPNDISTWGANAVVCDPWAEKTYLLSEFQEMQKIENDVRYAPICYQKVHPQPYLSGTLYSQYREELPAFKLVRASIFNNSENIEINKMPFGERNIEHQENVPGS